MRIKAFSYLIKNEATPYQLKDSAVVIDAHNYFYNFYEESQLPFAFGCESNRFANYLKANLSNLKKANLRCYFVFKGGSTDVVKKLNKKKLVAHDLYDSENVLTEFTLPIFAGNICKQVLDEMEFDYVDTPLEAKDYCITLAQRLSCPIVSQDVEYVLSKVPYIPRIEISYDQEAGAFNCVKFDLDNLLTKYELSDDKLVLFIVLTNTDCFPENYFIKFLQNNRIPINNYYRLISLLKWLSGLTIREAMAKIFKFLKSNERKDFLLNVETQTEHLRMKQEGLSPNMFLYDESARITKNDRMWFEKGVVNKFIGKPYIDLYYTNVFVCPRTINNFDDTKFLLSKDIIIYVYNLLTNYTKKRFEIYHSTGERVDSADTIMLPFPKPKYEADNSVFENGWNVISSLGLFEHFLKGTMRGIDLEYLEELPADAKLLMITLTYFSVKSSRETLDELYSILISYIMLGIVFEDRENVYISKSDCELAIDATKNYFQSNNCELKSIVNRNINYPLIEFQYCLEQMNYLNTLCGSPYKPTIYSKTYNGTFVYKILYSLKTKGLDRKDFLTNIFDPTPSVLEYLQNLVKIHEHLISSIEK